MYRRTTNTNGATANYWVPGAEFGAPVSSIGQAHCCSQSLCGNCLCAQGFSFHKLLFRACTATHNFLSICPQAQQYNVARGFANPVNTPRVSSPVVSGDERERFIFTNSRSPLAQGRVPRRGHSMMFPASPAPSFARTQSFGGGASGNDFHGHPLSSTRFGAVPASAYEIPRATSVQSMGGQFLGPDMNHFGTSPNVVPKPDPTLQARLKPVAAEEAERRDRKTKCSMWTTR